MFVITNTFTESDLEQAVRLARANYVDLFNKYVKAHGPTSSLCMLQVETEVREYLKDALTGCHGLSVGAVFAKDQNTGEVIGFVICLTGHIVTDCGLNYMVVDKRYRRQGVMRAMLGDIMNRFSFIGISCNVDKVPYYEALNFRVTGSDMVQVAMSWGLNKAQATMSLINFDGSVELHQAMLTFMRVAGTRGNAIMNKLAKEQERQISYVKLYASKRLSGASHASSV